MEIDDARFPIQCIEIIQEIADSHFVAFDLEFSGVAGRTRSSSGGKPTLQELYDAIKGAAEQYQVLQVGLTVAKEVKAEGICLSAGVAWIQRISYVLIFH